LVAPLLVSFFLYEKKLFPLATKAFSLQEKVFSRGEKIYKKKQREKALVARAH
jgi:hypothetical protein